jgi:hypothetical protein
MQCEAKAKSTGQQCQRAAVAGRNVCVVHGGKTPRGLSSPNFKTGRYSKDIPANLSASYRTALSDPALLNFDEDVALLQSMVLDALRRADTSESAAAWKAAKSMFLAMIDAMTEGDLDGTLKAREALRLILVENVAKYAARDEAIDLILKKSKLANDERKRRIEQQQMIAVERVMILLTAVIAGLKESVGKYTDRDTGNQILQDTNEVLRRLFERPNN